MIQQPPTRDHMTSDEVKSVRAQLGMSQAEFGRALGLSRKTIQAYEGNRLWPSQQVEERIKHISSPAETRRHALRDAIKEAITLADDLRHMCNERTDEGSAEAGMYEQVQAELNNTLRSIL